MEPHVRLELPQEHWLVTVLKWACLIGALTFLALVFAVTIHYCTEAAEDPRDWRINSQTVELDDGTLRVDFTYHAPYYKLTIRHDRLPFQNIHLLFDPEGAYVGSGTTLLESDILPAAREKD